MGHFMCWASVFEFYLYLHPKENTRKLCLWMRKVSEMTILWATLKYLAVFSFRLPLFSRWSIWSSLRDKGTRLMLVFITLYCTLHCKHNLSSDFLLGLKLVCRQSPKLSYCILVSHLDVLKKKIRLPRVFSFVGPSTLLSEWYICTPSDTGGGRNGMWCVCVAYTWLWGIYLCM